MKNNSQHSEHMKLQAKIAEIYKRIKPAPDDESNPTAWTSIIQTALERTTQHISRLEIFSRFNPYIWELIGDRTRHFGSFGSFGSLNPQPIPPRWLFAHELARVIVERMRLMSDIAEGIQKGSAQKNVESYIIEFTESICPDPPKIKIPKDWPFPEPQPDPRWNAVELVAVAKIFIEESMQSNLKSAYQTAASRIIEVASKRTT